MKRINKKLIVFIMAVALIAVLSVNCFGYYSGSGTYVGSSSGHDVYQNGGMWVWFRSGVMTEQFFHVSGQYTDLFVTTTYNSPSVTADYMNYYFNSQFVRDAVYSAIMAVTGNTCLSVAAVTIYRDTDNPYYTVPTYAPEANYYSRTADMFMNYDVYYGADLRTDSNVLIFRSDYTTGLGVFYTPAGGSGQTYYAYAALN